MGHEENFCAYAPNAVGQLQLRSGFERFVGQEIDPWTRGMLFTWIWEDLGRKWHGYDQFLFFRGTRKWYLVYVPYFWRSVAEFERFEKQFIEAATARRGTISQAAFAQQGRAFRSRLNLGMIQGPLLGAVAKGGGIIGGAAKAMDKVGDWANAIKCAQGDEGSCVSVLQGFALRNFKDSVSR